MNSHLNIDRIPFIGRTYDEYLSLFDLDEKTIRQGPVLDCPAGAASFTAEAAMSGMDVTACDILYNRGVDSLDEMGRRDIEHIHHKVKEVPHLFKWNYYKDIDNLIFFREAALSIFIDDFGNGLKEGRYRYAELPDLPFADRKFSLVLSSHFLFLYGDRLEFNFHIACIMELVRVCAGEVRLYPLTGLDARPYKYLDDIRTVLNSNGIEAETVRIPFEFQKGSSRMMRIICR